jgi:hypothetical protein
MLLQDRTKLLLLSHNFSYVMINTTSINEVHYFPGDTKCITLPFLGLILFVSVLPTPPSVFPFPGSPAGVTPIIWSLNFWNKPPWSGLVA